MNIIFVTQDEPFYVRHFFKSFLARYPYRDEIKGVLIQKPLGTDSRTALLRKVFSFYGAGGFLVMGIKYLLLKLGDIFSLVSGFPWPVSLRGILKKYGVPLLQFRSVNTTEFIHFLRKERVCLVVSVAASQIFKKDVLFMPPRGCINIHSGQLSKYRGMMPNFWTLYNKENYAWVTIHKMTEKLDAGPVILEDKFKINERETYNSLVKRSKKFAAQILIEVLKIFREDKAADNFTPAGSGRYYRFPTKEDLRLFRAQRGRIV